MLKQNPSVEMIVSETHLRRSYNVLRVHVQRLLNSTTKCHFRVNWPVSILSRFPSCAAYTHNMGTAYKTQLICRPSFRWLYFEPTWHAGFLNRYWAIHCNFNGPWIKVRKEAKIKKKKKTLTVHLLAFFLIIISLGIWLTRYWCLREGRCRCCYGCDVASREPRLGQEDPLSQLFPPCLSPPLRASPFSSLLHRSVLLDGPK